MPFEEYVFVLRVVRLEALCKLQQDSSQNQQDKFKPEVENTGAFPLVLAKGNVQLCQKEEILWKTSSLLGSGEYVQATETHKTGWTLAITTQLCFFWFKTPMPKMVLLNLNNEYNLKSKLPAGWMLHGQKRLHPQVSSP